MKTLSLLCIFSLNSFSFQAKPNVLLFIIDGLQSDAAKVAIANGAANLKYFHNNGVWVQEAYCTSPAPIAYLPDNSRPWGTASPPNVAMHTGTHVFESRDIDDVFLAAKRAGIISVFSGSARNYSVFTTPDFHFVENLKDSLVVSFAIDRIVNDNAQLVSIHAQELRDGWTGPEDKLRPDSRYQLALLKTDALLGKLIGALKSEGLWDSSYVIISSDHGMGMTKRSDHPASEISSWGIYMNFYGPGIRQGATIPYAETPDIAMLIAHILRFGSLKGHTDSTFSIEPYGTTGILLTNIFEKNPPNINHPQLIKTYLERKNWKPSDEYAEYRSAMIELLKQMSH